MDTVYDLTASQWLSLTDHAAASLFPAPLADRLAMYRKLAQRWHPDRNPDAQATEVFMRIQRLHRQHVSRSAAVSVVKVVATDGRTFHYQPHASEPFVLGQFHRASASIAYQVDVAHQALFDNARTRIAALSFANGNMRASMSPLLPSLAGCPWGNEGGLIVIRKPQDAIRLRDLHAFSGHLDPRHVAWILSGLFNLACYLEHQRIAHHDISLDTVWIRPASHEVLLLGGWFFACAFEAPVSALPAHAAQLASPRYLANRVAGPGVDAELIRGLGRELMGDRMGQRLPATIPEPMRRFLTDPPASTALDDYRGWKHALKASFGPPTFVPMPFSISEIYKENPHG